MLIKLSIQAQPINPLDTIDPFQSYPINPVQAAVVPQPNGSRGEALPQHQVIGQGLGEEQGAALDRVVNHGQ